MTANASEIVVEGGGPAPRLVFRGKAALNLAVILDLSEVGPGEGPGGGVDGAYISLLPIFLCSSLCLGQPTSEPP